MTHLLCSSSSTLFSLCQKWEEENQKAFMATPTKPHAGDDRLLRLQCLLTPSVYGPEVIFYQLSPEQLDDLSNYINDKRTASSVPSEGPRRPSPEIVTSELVYYWMTALKINWEAQYWHFNRLMMLIAITNFKAAGLRSEQNRTKLFDKWRDQNAKNKQLFNTQG